MGDLLPYNGSVSFVPWGIAIVFAELESEKIMRPEFFGRGGNWKQYNGCQIKPNTQNPESNAHYEKRTYYKTRPDTRLSKSLAGGQGQR